ncbi:hypothetical protein LSH36_513g01033 [Paralvinella palmiformis]|uniref:Uncharacterized protein n=1 Tax=Paralvinella palmiformis TaxID=53620 RepID=A0AAD9MYY4_9ANNE|nr:hypothetical protein LSH36_513g01033 [Paralvinella palmiformis]
MSTRFYGPFSFHSLSNRLVVAQALPYLEFQPEKSQLAGAGFFLFSLARSTSLLLLGTLSGGICLVLGKTCGYIRQGKLAHRWQIVIVQHVPRIVLLAAGYPENGKSIFAL